MSLSLSLRTYNAERTRGELSFLASIPKQFCGTLLEQHCESLKAFPK